MANGEHQPTEPRQKAAGCHVDVHGERARAGGGRESAVRRQRRADAAGREDALVVSPCGLFLQSRRRKGTAEAVRTRKCATQVGQLSSHSTASSISLNFPTLDFSTFDFPILDFPILHNKYQWRPQQLPYVSVALNPPPPPLIPTGCRRRRTCRRPRPRQSPRCPRPSYPRCRTLL